MPLAVRRARLAGSSSKLEGALKRKASASASALLPKQKKATDLQFSEEQSVSDKESGVIDSDDIADDQLVPDDIVNTIKTALAKLGIDPKQLELLDRVSHLLAAMEDSGPIGLGPMPPIEPAVASLIVPPDEALGPDPKPLCVSFLLFLVRIAVIFKDCKFCSADSEDGTPRPSGHGGGVANVFKSYFKNRKINIDVYSSFEVQLMRIDIGGPVLCALVFRPPKFNKDFIEQFSAFLADTVSRCDRLLILGDFNIHLCCPSKPLVNEFLFLIESLNLSQFVSAPTHNLGHTLDLVLSLGVPITNLSVIDAAFSDYLPIVFEFDYDSPTPTCPKTVSYSRLIQSSTARLFSEHYLANCIDPVCFDKLSTEEMVEVFTNSCSISIDSVAPLKLKKAKDESCIQPWLNAHTRVLRQQCRKAERKWKKDKLQVSYECLMLAELVGKVKTSSCESDVIPTRLFKEVFVALSPACYESGRRRSRLFVTHGLSHYTPDYTPHQPLHFTPSNQRQYKYPGLPFPCFCPFGTLACLTTLLPSPLRITFAAVSTLACYMDCSSPCCPNTCLPLFDPACLTMSMSRPFNKSMQMDPLVSRLVPTVTEYSATKGSSSFSPGHSADMDFDFTLFRIKQGQRSLNQYIREFLALANYSTLPDCTIIEIFCDGVNEPLKARLRREGPRSSLVAFMNFAFMCVGSPCTVGVAEEERDNADMVAANPSRRLAVTPDRDPTNTFAAWIAREMAAVQERAQAMAATAVPVHKMAAARARSQDGGDGGVCSQDGGGNRAPQVRAIAPISSHVTAIFPEPSTVKMAATPEPLHRMAAVSKPLLKMAVIPEPVHKMAAIPKSVHKMAALQQPAHMMAHVLDSPLIAVWAAKMELRRVTAAVPAKTSQDTASFPVSSQASPRPNQAKAALPEPSQIAGASSESSQAPAATPRSSQASKSGQAFKSDQASKSGPATGSGQDTVAVLHESSQYTAVLYESSQHTAVPHESRQVTAVHHELSQEPSQVTAVVPEPSHVTAVIPELSHVTAVVPETSQAKADLHEPSQVTADLRESSPVSKSCFNAASASSQASASNQASESGQANTVIPESSKFTAAASESSQSSKSRNVRAVVSESSKVSTDIPESSKVTAGLREPRQVTTELHKPSLVSLTHPEPGLVSSDRSEPSHVSSDRPEPGHVSSDHPEPYQASFDGPESSHAPSDYPKSSHISFDLPRPRPIGIASALGPPQPPAAALPLMAIAIWCVWAAHCAPEATPAHKSAPEVTSVHKPAPEATTAHKSPPEPPSGHKPAPEPPSGHKPAPELPSGHRPAPELPSVGEAAPIPPEVSASAVDPPLEVPDRDAASCSAPEGRCASCSAPEGCCASCSAPEGRCASCSAPEGRCASCSAPEGCCASCSAFCSALEGCSTFSPYSVCLLCPCSPQVPDRDADSGSALEGSSVACSASGSALEGFCSAPEGSCSASGSAPEGSYYASGSALEGSGASCPASGSTLEGSCASCSASGTALEGSCASCSASGSALEGFQLHPGGLLLCRSCLNHRVLRRDLVLQPLPCLAPAPPLPWTVVLLERLEAALWGGAMLRIWSVSCGPLTTRRRSRLFVTHGLSHYTPDYTPHQPLHFTPSNQRQYKYPGLPVTLCRPFTDYVRRCIDPRLLYGLFFTLLSKYLFAVV
ncbi:hypothetical protein H4Q32_019149 [Labeo rohita]|uniref:Uncharacterized protein n=1 Tax=Labeo rohita TaxID=84645 RepID=A0ABQ8LKD4_LABRO|nr:hypothetical protein H4Q32_019149 [Labeo rohita]